MGKAAWMRETMNLRKVVADLKKENERLSGENAELVSAIDVLTQATAPSPHEASEESIPQHRKPGRPKKHAEG